jgi:succinoglycan biosynthesis transport protein ExoP
VHPSETTDVDRVLLIGTGAENMLLESAVAIESAKQKASVNAEGDRAGLIGLVQFVKRYKASILISMIVTFSIAVLYTLMTPSIYTASSLVLVEPKYSSWSNSVVGNINTQVVVDSGQLESQIQLIRSAPIAGPVYRGLQLEDSSLFQSRPNLLSKAMSYLRPGPLPEPAPQLSLDRINALGNMTGVRRIGQSYVIEISFAAANPVLAARICNSITAAYIGDRLKSRIEAAQNGNEILATKLSTLNEQRQQLDEAIATGDMDVERLPSADARVISAAIVPFRPSWPRTVPILALSLMVGLALGFTIGLVRRSLEVNRAG